jgi:propionyl-CoA carboxylase alpha chain
MAAALVDADADHRTDDVSGRRTQQEPEDVLTKVLIANRGEIAVRIARTCRAMGIGTVAVFSDVDAGALHVAVCDEAVRLGGATPTESYLRGEAIIDAAHRVGADAIHPGFGFLSENAQFARDVADAGLVWIGPTADAIEVMGDKIQAKRRMRDAGVPLVAGRELDDAVDVWVAGDHVGYPLMVKAAAGGGGKGMRIVTDPDDLEDAVEAARREAAGAFGDERVFLERLVTRPRHVEIQVLADAHGNVVHLFERECSIQRRHQKVIEEAPSPGIDEQVRAAMGEAAVAAAREIGYVNAGTVEFIADENVLARRRAGEDVDPQEAFAFLEVNTRLQVEHPVTEEVTRIRDHGRLEPVDLVRLQLLVAMGEALPFGQQDLVQVGHAIEARLYAEDPANDYLPVTGTLHEVTWFDLPGLRYDSGVRSGDVISPHYDPMLAKVIAAAPTRTEAAARLARALDRSVIHGTVTNRDLLVDVLRDETFLAGQTTTGFLGERFPAPETHLAGVTEEEVATALVAVTLEAALRRRETAAVLPTLPAGFSNTSGIAHEVGYLVGEHEHRVAYRQDRDGAWTVTCDDRGERVVYATPVGDGVLLEVDGHRQQVSISRHDRSCEVHTAGARLVVEELPRFPEAGLEQAVGATLAPMPGSVVSVAVAEGDEVAEGALLVTVEAMKMEHRITAPFAGRVAEVRVAAGQQVDADEVLVVVEDPDSEDDEA